MGRQALLAGRRRQHDQGAWFGRREPGHGLSPRLDMCRSRPWRPSYPCNPTAVRSFTLSTSKAEVDPVRQRLRSAVMSPEWPGGSPVRSAVAGQESRPAGALYRIRPSEDHCHARAGGRGVPNVCSPGSALSAMRAGTGRSRARGPTTSSGCCTATGRSGRASAGGSASTTGPSLRRGQPLVRESRGRCLAAPTTRPAWSTGTRWRCAVSAAIAGRSAGRSVGRCARRKPVLCNPERRSRRRFGNEMVAVRTMHTRWGGGQQW